MRISERVIRKLDNKEKLDNSRSVRRALKRLEKKRLVFRGKLTKLGKLEALRFRPKKRLAKGMLLVIFDIPERYRGLRALLRRFIKRLGLKQWQKSIWITKLDVREELTAFIQGARLGKMVKILHAKQISNY